MRIAIIGTRGIPNNYGGFEQCAEYLAVGLVEQGHRVLVYSSHDHPWQKKEWHGVEIVHCFDPEDSIGTKGQFIYDFNCIRDVRKRKCDVILQMGYTSSSVWGWMLPRKNTIITTNMDGLEWKRTKFSERIRKFLKYAEKLGVKYSDHLIADSIGIKDYLIKSYGKDSTYIPYGAHLFNSSDITVLDKYKVKPYNYNLLIARLEHENSIEIILDGVVNSKMNQVFLVIGNHNTPYGNLLKNKYPQKNIYFVGGIYNIEELNNLRYYSRFYFHGHTVGGTNPSLLEAMASNSMICANDNLFNRCILGDDAYYFKNANDVTKALLTAPHKNQYSAIIENNRIKIQNLYSWERIIKLYADHFASITKQIQEEVVV